MRPSAGSLGQVQDAPQQDELGLWLQQSSGHSQTSDYEQEFQLHCRASGQKSRQGMGQELTWTAEMCMLILLVNADSQAPRVVGKRKEVLRLSRAGDGSS